MTYCRQHDCDQSFEIRMSNYNYVLVQLYTEPPRQASTKPQCEWTTYQGGVYTKYRSQGINHVAKHQPPVWNNHERAFYCTTTEVILATLHTTLVVHAMLQCLSSRWRPAVHRQFSLNRGWRCNQFSPRLKITAGQSVLSCR